MLGNRGQREVLQVIFVDVLLDALAERIGRGRARFRMPFGILEHPQQQRNHQEARLFGSVLPALPDRFLQHGKQGADPFPVLPHMEDRLYVRRENAVLRQAFEPQAGDPAAKIPQRAALRAFVMRYADIVNQDIARAGVVDVVANHMYAVPVHNIDQLGAVPVQVHGARQPSIIPVDVAHTGQPGQAPI